MTLADNDSAADTATGASGPTETSTSLYTCQQCGKTFKSMTRLRNHTRTHPVDLSGLQSSLDFFSNTKPRPTLEGFALTALQDEIIESRTEEVIHVDQDTTTYTSSSLARPTTADISDDYRKTLRRRSGIPLSFGNLKSHGSTERRISLHVTAMMNSRHAKSVNTLNARRVISPIRPATLPSSTRQSIQTTPVSSKHDARTTPASLSKPPSGGTSPAQNKTYVIATVAGTPPTSRRQSMTAIASMRTNPSTTREASTARTPVKMFTSTPIKTVTPKRPRYRQNSTPNKRSNSRTPNKRSNSKTPNRKVQLGSRRTPKSGKKTPKSTKGTPRNPGGETQTAPSGLGHKCNRCGKVFVSEKMLDIHYVIHVRESPTACGVPNEVIKKRTGRRIKAAKQTTVQNIPYVETKTYACTQCSRVYQHDNFLQAHMKTHLIETPYACDICHKRFKFLSSLKSHKICHIGETSHNEALKSIAKGEITGNRRLSKAYEEECDALNLIGSVRNIFSVVSLKDAMVEDISDCPFVCSTCDFKTSDPVGLLKHMRTHSARRQHTCTECNRSYASKTNLELHGKTHVIEKLRHVLTSRARTGNGVSEL